MVEIMLNINQGQKSLSRMLVICIISLLMEQTLINQNRFQTVLYTEVTISIIYRLTENLCEERITKLYLFYILAR